jgi:hypothetical protein
MGMNKINDQTHAGKKTEADKTNEVTELIKTRQTSEKSGVLDHMIRYR